MIAVRSEVTPEARPTVENLRFNLDSKPDLTYVVGRIDDEPVACGFVEPWPSFAWGDIAVVAGRRRRGIGSAVLADLSERARALGKDRIQFEVKQIDAESRTFLERRRFEPVGREEAFTRDLAAIDAPAVDPPAGVSIASPVEDP